MENSNQAIEKVEKLAKKSYWGTGLLTFFLLPIGYIYTGRFQAFLKGFGITFGILLLSFVVDPSLEDDDNFEDKIWGLYAIIATIENTRAVNKAKQLKGKLTTNSKNTLTPDVQVQLLKFAQKRGEVTVSDCVIETGLTSQEVRAVLDELQREDVMRIANRDQDGAIVYRVV